MPFESILVHSPPGFQTIFPKKNRSNRQEAGKSIPSLALCEEAASEPRSGGSG